MKSVYISLLFALSLEAQFFLNAESMHNKNTYKLETQDVVFSKDSIRFTFKTDKNDVLRIYYDNKGSLEEIYSKQLSKDQIYTFPESKKWIVLNDDIGIERFIFKLSNEKKVFELNHIAKIAKINQGKAKLDTDKKILTSTGLKKIKNRTYFDLTDVKSNTRGPTEIKVYKQLSKSVVLINADGEIGSGVVISNDGKVLSNWHVVKDKSSVLVAFKPKIGNKPTKNSYYLAHVAQVNIEKDLALLQLDNKNLTSNITPLKLSNIEGIEVGQDVFSIGHPLGELWTFNTGLVSQIRTDYTWTTSNIKHSSDYIIQTQNSISRGNSGGPLVNENNELLGINTLSKSAGQNLNFSISVSDIKSFLNQSNDKTIQNDYLESTPNFIKYNIVKTKHGIDVKGNKISRAYVDSDNNGKIDISLIDIHRNGKWNLFYADANENNIYEEKKVDRNGDGIIELIYKDTNEDGQWDLIGYDKNEDGKIEKWSSF